MHDPVDLDSLHPRRSRLQQLIAIDLGARLTPPDVEFPVAEEVETGDYSHGRGPDLAIDFGTSAIAAALVGGNHAFEELRFDGEPLLEAYLGRRQDLGCSALSDNYDLNFRPYYQRPGDTSAPTWEYYPCLKRRIEWLARCDESGAWQPTAVLDVAAVCRIALERAHTSHGTPITELLAGREFRIYITVPNAFPRAAIDVLARGVGYGVAAALRTPEVPKVLTLLEAEAVAYGAVARPALADTPSKDSTVLVVDAGAGTTDASIVRAEEGFLRVLAHVGLPVGGMDLDAFAARLHGPFENLGMDEISQRLRTSQEQKEQHLSDAGQVDVEDDFDDDWDEPATQANNGLPPDPFAAQDARLPIEDTATLDDRATRAAVARLADALRGYGWPDRTDEGISLERALLQAHRRYLALAVRTLLLSLPREELANVTQVVLSGRSSLLAGFRSAVRRCLRELGVQVPIRADDGDRGRKLAVVRGVGAFVASTYRPQWERRPVRASFDIVLRHSGTDELRLLPAGQPLLEGWGVAAWYQPPLHSGDDAARPAVDMRMIPKSAIHHLQQDFSADELEELLSWAAIPVLRLQRRAPFAARIAFDFLTLDVTLDVDGRPAPVQKRPPDTHHLAFGRRHPVHKLAENWFEIFHRSLP